MKICGERGDIMYVRVAKLFILIMSSSLKNLHFLHELSEL